MPAPIVPLLLSFLGGGAVGYAKQSSQNAAVKRKEESDAVATMSTQFAEIGNKAGIEANKQAIIQYQGKDVYERLLNQAQATSGFYGAMTGGQFPPTQPGAGQPAAQPPQAPGAPTPAQPTTPGAPPTAPRPSRFEVTQIKPGAAAPFTLEPTEDPQLGVRLAELYDQYSATPDVTPDDAWDTAMEALVNEAGRLPSPDVLRNIKPDIDQDYENKFNSVFTILTASDHLKPYLTLEQRDMADNFQRQIRLNSRGLSGDALQNAIRMTAFQVVQQSLGGYAPESLRTDISAGIEPPITPDVAEKGYAIFGKRDLSPEELTAARAALEHEELAAGVKEKKALTRAGYELEGEKPISAEDVAKYGITKDYKTYGDIVAGGQRLASPDDIKQHQSVDAVMSVVGQLDEMAFGIADIPGIFTSGDDLASRSLHGLYLAQEAARGTPLGVVTKDYADAIQAMPRILLPLMGEQGGRFTDKDMEQILKMVPKVFPIPDGKSVASRKLNRLKMFLKKKVDLIFKPKLIKMDEPAAPSAAQEGPQMDEIWEDADGNRAIYKGKDEKGKDIWQTTK